MAGQPFARWRYVQQQQQQVIGQSSSSPAGPPSPESNRNKSINNGNCNKLSSEGLEPTHFISTMTASLSSRVTGPARKRHKSSNAENADAISANEPREEMARESSTTSVDPLDLSTCNSQNSSVCHSTGSGMGGSSGSSNSNNSNNSNTSSAISCVPCSSTTTVTWSENNNRLDDPSAISQQHPRGFIRNDCDRMSGAQVPVGPSPASDVGRNANNATLREQGTLPATVTSAMATAGSSEEAHRCDMCGKTFAVPARLTRHYRTHTGERPFVCEVCGKSFSVKENLSVHRRIHTKEKPYRCPHCGRGFEHSGKLHRHMRIHTGERPHQCSDCGKTFIQSGQLVIHMRSHTGEKPYVCTVCNKGFTCSKQLKVHSRTHTGERPYACDVCGKTFAYNHVLKLHQMAHLGERLYKCTLCSETYSSKKALETHIKTHGCSPTRHSPAPSTSATTPSPGIAVNQFRLGALSGNAAANDMHPTLRLGQSMATGVGYGERPTDQPVDKDKSPLTPGPSSLTEGSPNKVSEVEGVEPQKAMDIGIASIVESINPKRQQLQQTSRLASGPWDNSTSGSNSLSLSQHSFRSDDRLYDGKSSSFACPQPSHVIRHNRNSNAPPIRRAPSPYASDGPGVTSNNAHLIGRNKPPPILQPVFSIDRHGPVGTANSNNVNLQLPATSSTPHLRPMPPLIPVTALSASPGNSIALRQHHHQYNKQDKGTCTFQQQTAIQLPSLLLHQRPSLGESLPATDRHGGPPRKSSRFRAEAGEGALSSSESDSPNSSASSSPSSAMMTDGIAANITTDHTIRSTSVIRFAHRRPGSAGSDSSPTRAASSNQS